MKDFVYLKQDYRNVKQFEVGIVEATTGNKKHVLFATGKEEKDISSDLLETFDIKKVGDQYDKKICNMCGRILSTNEFEPNQHGKNNRLVRRPSCRSCRATIDGKNIPTSERKEWNQRKPNYIVWTCPICKKTSIPGVTCKVVLDHNHHTGHPRDWICDSCNTGLGRFKDDITILKNAISYLEEHDIK